MIFLSYCMYLRKSRKDLEMERLHPGSTLLRHESVLRSLADSMSLPVLKIYREVGSGDTISGRPVMKQLLSEVEQGKWEGVLVMEIERLARGDSIDQGIVTRTFQYSGTRIITPYKIYEPENDFELEYFEFSLFMSRREYKTINRRMQAGRLASIKEGKYVGNIAPYGYDRIRLPDRKGFTLCPNHESPAVRLIFSLYGEKSFTISEVVGELNRSRTYHPRKAPVFTYSSVHDILDNPVYIGKLRWNYRKTSPKLKDGILTAHRPRQNDYLIVQGLHHALISEDLFFTVQKRLHPYSEQKNSPIWK